MIFIIQLTSGAFSVYKNKSINKANLTLLYEKRCNDPCIAVQVHSSLTLSIPHDRTEGCSTHNVKRAGCSSTHDRIYLCSLRVTFVYHYVFGFCFALDVWDALIRGPVFRPSSLHSRDFGHRKVPLTPSLSLHSSSAGDLTLRNGCRDCNRAVSLPFLGKTA